MAKKSIKVKDGDIIEKNGRKWSVASLEKFRNYQQDYIKNHYTGFTFRFRTDDDKDVIKQLKKQKSAAKYVKELIRNDMKKY